MHADCHGRSSRSPAPGDGGWWRPYALREHAVYTASSTGTPSVEQSFRELREAAKMMDVANRTIENWT